MNKSQTIPFILLLLVFLLWLYFKPEETVPEQTKHQPNYIAYDVSNTHFDTMGEITYKIYSEQVTSLPDQNITVFKNPNVTVYIANKKNNKTTIWQMNSKTGMLYRQKKLVLTNAVWVKNLSLDQLIQSMHTEKLTISLDTKEISSDLLVSWQGPQMQQQGIGMWASLITEELIIKDKIKAVYLNENK